MEIMAAMVIFTIVLAAVFSTFLFQQQSYTNQSRVAEMQQNLRLGIEYLARDIRMAGYGIPAAVTLPTSNPTGVILPSGTTTIRALFPVDNTARPDSVYILYLYDIDANQPATRLNAAMGSTATSISVDNVYGFDNGTLILVKSTTAADLFQLTGPGSGNTLPHDAAGYNASGAHATWPTGGYPVIADNSVKNVAKARFIRYYIDNTTDPSHPTLMVDRMTGQPPQPVADDIEDMQFQYGLDTTGTPDGIVDTWTDNPANTTQIRQVRIMLLARSRLPEKGWKETRPALGNRTAGTTIDGYRRRIMDMVVDVRNSGVQ